MALVALIHDIVITIGVYSLSGFPVTPAAVTGLLAILGFSMYDTVDFVKRAVANGACGYLMKDAPPFELVQLYWHGIHLHAQATGGLVLNGRELLGWQLSDQPVERPLNQVVDR